jgi:hypothetical protein
MGWHVMLVLKYYDEAIQTFATITLYHQTTN